MVDPLLIRRRGCSAGVPFLVISREEETALEGDYMDYLIKWIKKKQMFLSM